MRTLAEWDALAAEFLAQLDQDRAAMRPSQDGFDALVALAVFPDALVRKLQMQRQRYAVRNRALDDVTRALAALGDKIGALEADGYPTIEPIETDDSERADLREEADEIEAAIAFVSGKIIPAATGTVTLGTPEPV